jgi:AraC family transcriptional regulator
MSVCGGKIHRAQCQLQNIELVEHVKMDQTFVNTLETPRFVYARPMLIAGTRVRYSCESSTGIPAQWQRFLPHFGNIYGQVGRMAYGVKCNADGAKHFDYVCGVEASEASASARLPPDWTRVRIPEHQYAVFMHREHVSSIHRTCYTIWNQWLPESELEAGDAPDFERYREDFDSQTGLGGVEIWIPIKAPMPGK